MKITNDKDSSQTAIGESKGNESFSVSGAISYDSEEDIADKQNNNVLFLNSLPCDEVSLGSDASFDLGELENEKDDMEKILDFTAFINSNSRAPQKSSKQADRFMESSPNLSSGYQLPGSNVVENKRSNSFSSFSNLEVTRDSFEAVKEEAKSIMFATQCASWKPRAPINIFEDDWDEDSEEC